MLYVARDTDVKPQKLKHKHYTFKLASL